MQQPTYADLVEKRREQLRREQMDRAREIATRLRPPAQKALPAPVAAQMPRRVTLVLGDAPAIPKPAPSPIMEPESHKRDWIVVATNVKVARVLISEIKARVAARHRISLDQLLSPSREFRFSHARQEVMYFAHALSAQSLPAIGRALGNRDHTTVLHGVRAFAARAGIPVDPDKSTALRWLFEGVRT